MYIKDENAPSRNLKVPGMEEPIDIDEDGVARVTRDVGEALIEHCETIEEHTNE